MGKPWTGQELGDQRLLDVLNQVRKDVRDGHFDWKSWDHNSPEFRPGRSNKQIRIAGAMLTGNPEVTQREAEAAVMEAVLG